MPNKSLAKIDEKLSDILIDLLNHGAQGAGNDELVFTSIDYEKARRKIKTLINSLIAVHEKEVLESLLHEPQMFGDWEEVIESRLASLEKDEKT